MKQSSSNESRKILIPRISQLDANEFDREIHKILFNQIIEISNYFRPGTLSGFRAELTLLLNLIIFKYSLLQNKSTFGQDLLGLKYDSLTKSKFLLYAVLKYFFPYLYTKYEDNLGKVDNIKVIHIMRKIEIVIKFSHILNLLIFLKKGTYPTLTDRLLRLKYVPTDKFSRSVGYSFMMRQLLWHGFMELLTHIVPMINFALLKRNLKSFLSPSISSNKIKTFAQHKSQTKCVICNDYLIMPCVISLYCPHAACYYCLRSNTLADDKFSCPECNEPNTVSERPVFL